MERPLADVDPEVSVALLGEKDRQGRQIELIASENIVSGAVREALGHEINNKTLEGYPGNRFHGRGRVRRRYRNTRRQESSGVVRRRLCQCPASLRHPG